MSDSKPVHSPAGSPVASSAATPTGTPPASKSWNTVNQPGAYVCNDTGRLFRVPASALKDGNTPVIELYGPNGPSKVTRISEDPSLPIADLRLKSAAASIKPQF